MSAESGIVIIHVFKTECEFGKYAVMLKWSDKLSETKLLFVNKTGRQFWRPVLFNIYI
ncbi:MAG: hypothetical protein JNL23_02500 [Chitinophagaceae bacterium]|nr:hypothetical protein [Chitinophagaceae bacterium]